MNVRLPNDMIQRIERRAQLCGLTSQEVIRRCLTRRLIGVENRLDGHISTPRDSSVSTPIESPPGMSAPEIRARIHLALDVTEAACAIGLKIDPRDAATAFEVVEA